MRKLHNLQTLFDFNPIHPKTEKTVALLDELLKELGTKILQKVEADLTYHLKIRTPALRECRPNRFCAWR